MQKLIYAFVMQVIYSVKMTILINSVRLLMKQTNFQINFFISIDVAQNCPEMVKVHLLIKYFINAKHTLVSTKS